MEVLQDILSPSPERCEERQALEAQYLGFNRGCATFREIWGHIMKLSVPQCLQLQNEGNKVPSLTARIHFFKGDIFLTAHKRMRRHSMSIIREMQIKKITMRCHYTRMAKIKNNGQ